MFKNIAWDFLGKFSVQIISFGISVVLTRLLSPAEFGIMGMAMAIVIIAHIFLDLGFNKAIIQKPEVSQVQYNTIFYLNVGVALLLTAICYLLAAPLAQFYRQPLIKPVFRVLSFIFLINGINLVPAAILYKKLLFKINSVLNIGASLIGGSLGIFLAYKGYGVWSLVCQALLSAMIIMVTNFVFARWVPTFNFNIRSIKPLWSYGSRMFASGLLDNIYTRLDVFIVGRLFTTSILGFYTRAQSMDNFVRQISVNSIMSGLFPYIAAHQNNRAYLATLYQKFLHLIAFVSIALSGTLLLIAPHLFTILFTKKWLYAAQLFQFMSVIGFAWPVSSLMCNVIAGVGNSKSFLRLEVYKKVLFLPVYGFGFLFGLKGFLEVFIVANLISVAMNAWFVQKEIAVTAARQLKIILSYFLIATAATALCFLIRASFNITNDYWNLLVLAAAFNVFYLLGTWITKLPAFDNIAALLRKLHTYYYDKRNKNIFATI